MNDARRLKVEGVSQPVEMTGGGAVLDVMERIAKDWEIAPAPPEGGAPGPASLTIHETGGAWTCASAATGESVTYSDPVAAACWLTANLVRWRTLENADQLCLHAAAVEIGGGLIAMPSRYRAGKSVLTATLAAMGARIFGDDILPVDPDTGDGIAAGIAPRLRLPLPDALSPETRAFIERRKGPESARYLYLDLPAALFAPKGTRLPFRGFALLERRDDGPAELTRVPQGDALKQVIWQNFARESAAGTILDRLAGIVLNAPCLLLRYASPEEGARALKDAFEAPSTAHLPEEPFVLDAERARMEGARAVADLAPETLIRRVEGCALTTRAGRSFLIGAEGLTILSLNELGAAVWRLLEIPTTFGEARALIAAAFPEQDETRIAADLKALIADLAANDAAELGP